MGKHKSKFLRGKRIDPAPIEKDVAVADLIDEAFLAYNAARLREACHLFSKKMLEPEVTIGVSITGALTPAGLGISASVSRCTRATRKPPTWCCAKKKWSAFMTFSLTTRCCSIQMRSSAR